MCYNFCIMKTALQTAFAYCLISTVACAAVAPHAKSEDGTLPDSCPASTFSATVWRGETAYVDIPAGVGSWSSELELESGGGSLVGVRGQESGVSVALGYYDEVAYEMQPGGVDVRKRPDVYREWGILLRQGCGGQAGNGKVPTVVRITAAADAKPGIYNFGPLEVTVLNRVLPPAKDWKYFLDLWQHPWAVSRYFKVKPFSKEHYAKMEPIYRTLAECGCKALTTTLLDLPWNHQCYDGYYSMIGREEEVRRHLGLRLQALRRVR